jgi:serine protease Do
MTVRFPYVGMIWAVLLLSTAQVNAESQDTYKQVSPSVVQVLLLDNASGTKSSFGSGFYAGDDGYIVTNFHVVSDLVFHPERHRAEAHNVNGESGDLTLLYFDVVNDLAVLRSNDSHGPELKIAEVPPPNGGRIYAMGHPHDLGLSVVEGTYNGLLADHLIPRIHYTGSLNPGMSGGPAVDENNRLVGVNVAGMGDQVSFLVPAKYVLALLEHADLNQEVDFKVLVSQQLEAHQVDFLEPILEKAFSEISLGPYQVPGKLSAAFECWGSSSEPDDRLFNTSKHKCETSDYIYLSSDDYTGTIEYHHEYFETDQLGTQRFYGFLERHLQTIHVTTAADEKRVTSFVCKQGLVENNNLNMKLVSCLRGHKVIDGLYDVFVILTTTEQENEALYSVLMLSGVSYKNGLSFQKRYLEAISLQGGVK